MAQRGGHEALFGPTPIAIHDDGNVLWQRVGGLRFGQNSGLEIAYDFIQAYGVNLSISRSSQAAKIGHFSAQENDSGSGVHFDLVVLKLHQGRTAQDFQQNSDAFAGDALNEAFDAAQGGVFEAHGLARLEVAELLQCGLVAVFFKLADALHEFVLQLSWLEAKADDGGNAFGAAHHRDALLRFAGPEQYVAREHGFKQRHRALFGFLEFFVERQIGFEGLLRQIDLGDLFLPWFGVGQVPPV